MRLWQIQLIKAVSEIFPQSLHDLNLLGNRQRLGFLCCHNF